MTNEAESDWDFYFCKVDDQPASIFVNLALAARVPVASHPYRSVFRVHMKLPRPDGLPGEEEAQTSSPLKMR